MLLLSGDQPGYRRHFADMLERPAPKSYPVARACPLAPDSVQDAAQLPRLVETELKGSPAFWPLAEQGALAYRTGRFDEAAVLLERSLQADSKPG